MRGRAAVNPREVRSPSLYSVANTNPTLNVDVSDGNKSARSVNRDFFPGRGEAPGFQPGAVSTSRFSAVPLPLRLGDPGRSWPGPLSLSARHSRDQGPERTNAIRRQLMPMAQCSGYNGYRKITKSSNVERGYYLDR
ncbi:hypothetical protein J6590_037898 [Homalodisca vitripennis]|nr:hypothetical protein J6590_037898 [Homalodisca vitripennis]